MVQLLIFFSKAMGPLMAAVALLIVSPVLAEQLYTVRSIPLDATASDSSKARSYAIAEGQERAFIGLLKRLTLPRDHSRIPVLNQEEISNYVQDFEISDEKRSDKRYIAELTVRFKRKMVKAFLAAEGVPFSEAESVPIVVLPIYRMGKSSILWEDVNPWREAWRRLEIKNELVNLIVPIGELSDVMTIDAGQALAGNRLALRKFARSYGADETLVAIAELKSDVLEQTSVDITIQNFGAAVGALEVERFELLPEETTFELLDRAVVKMAERLEYDWKVSNLLSYDQEVTLQAVVGVDGWSGWRSMVSRLEEVSVVQEVNIQSLSLNVASLEIKFFGDIDRLAVLLLRKNITLEGVGGAWLISSGEQDTQDELIVDPSTPLVELPELDPTHEESKQSPKVDSSLEVNSEELFIE